MDSHIDLELHEITIITRNCYQLFCLYFQLNQATHFLDGSQIYGSSNHRNRLLRGTEGYYKTSNINNKEYLPLSPNPTEDCMVSANNSLCFISGDPRVNFEPQITVMHTLWAREHNRLVDELRRLNNRHWNDDDLYEEARRIVIAMMQHITYSEWVRNVLGGYIFNLIFLIFPYSTLSNASPHTLKQTENVYHQNCSIGVGQVGFV